MTCLVTGVVSTLSVSPAAAATDVSMMFVTTATGGTLGGGATFQQESVTYQRPAEHRHRFTSVGDHTIVVEVRAASGPLVVGNARDLREPEYDEVRPGLRLTIDGSTCPTLGGGMTVDQIVYDAGGNVINFAMRFTARCSGETSDTFGGTVAYRSTVPVYAGTWTHMDGAVTVPFGVTDMVTFEFTNTGPSPLTVERVGMLQVRTTSGFFPTHQRSPVGGCFGVIEPGQRCAIGIPVGGDAVGSGVFRVVLNTQLFPMAGGPASTPLSTIGPEVSITGVPSAAGPAVGVIAADGEARAPVLAGGHLRLTDAINLAYSQNLRARPSSGDEWTAGFFFPSTPTIGQVYTRLPGQGSGAGLTFYETGGENCASGETGNSFVLDEYVAPAAGSAEATRLSGRFVQTCGSEPGNQVFGSITYPAGAPAYSHDIEPDSLGFGAVPPSTLSDVQTVTIRNDGTEPLAIKSIRIVGVDAADFTIMSSVCAASLLPGGACAVGIAFVPRSGGAKSAQLRVVDSLTDFAGDGRGQDVLLVGGTGTVVTPPPPTTLPPTTAPPVTSGPPPTSAPPGSPSTTVATASPPTVPPAVDDLAEFTSGGFVPVDPTRLLDTRLGTRAPQRRMRAGETMWFSPTGPGVRADGIRAVAVNVTATDSIGDGYLTVHPGGTTTPDSSNLNFRVGQDVANLVIVAVGDNGLISITAGPAATHVIVDLVGWYGDPTAGVVADRQHAIEPFRAVDTRHGTPLEGGDTRSLVLSGRDGVPADATAVIVNLTATRVTDSTFLTLFPGGTDRPGTSTLNVQAGETRPNLTIVRLGPGGTANVFLAHGRADILVDVVGYFGPGPGATFVGLEPFRAMNTRTDGGPFEPGDLDVLMVPTEIAGHRIVGVVLNVTVDAPDAGGYLTVFPGDVDDIPNVSNLNFASGTTVANLVVVKVPADGDVWFYAHGATTDVLVDVMGLVIE